jgi:MarR family transcriptional regulator, 2-MHQ and catechol-resistance regulon repressor
MVNLKHATTDIIEEIAFRSLLRTYGLIKQVMEPFFSTYGISGSQWAVLRILYNAKPRNLRLMDIGERLLIRPPSVTIIVERLMRLELIKCKKSSTDFRVKQVSLTSKGNELVEQILDGHKDKIKNIFSELNQQEKHILCKLLDNVKSSLERIRQ